MDLKNSNSCNRVLIKKIWNNYLKSNARSREKSPRIQCFCRTFLSFVMSSDLRKDEFDGLNVNYNYPVFGVLACDSKIVYCAGVRPSNQLSAYTSQHIPGVTLTTCNFDPNYDSAIWSGSRRIGSPRCWPQDSSDHSDQSGHRDSDHSVHSEHRDSGKVFPIIVYHDLSW